jgi:hypothetical protein
MDEKGKEIWRDGVRNVTATVHESYGPGIHIIQIKKPSCCWDDGLMLWTWTRTHPSPVANDALPRTQEVDV